MDTNQVDNVRRIVINHIRNAQYFVLFWKDGFRGIYLDTPWGWRLDWLDYDLRRDIRRYKKT
jgi:hypothetical protein